jgi:hypothetical protein
MDQALGKDFYRLILPSDLSRIHPVFHTSLLLPSCDPQDFPNRLGSRAPRGPASLNPIQDFWGEQDVEAIIGYWVPVKSRKTTHDYLVRWRGGSTADDSWVAGWMFSSEIHPYLELFHDTFGDQNIWLSPDKSVWILC